MQIVIIIIPVVVRPDMVEYMSLYLIIWCRHACRWHYIMLTVYSVKLSHEVL